MRSSCSVSAGFHSVLENKDKRTLRSIAKLKLQISSGKDLFKREVIIVF